MLLVFSQKLGLRMWLHNWIHHELVSQNNNSGSATETIQFKCDCADDFLMPLSETPVVAISAPVISFPISFSDYTPVFSSTEKIFHSLKGPPAMKNPAEINI